MQKKAFTLVELLVGITISILLMTSIGVFVSSGMSNIILQKKVLDDNKVLFTDFSYLESIIRDASKEVATSATGILLKVQPYFDRGGYVYIGTKEFSGEYCSGGGEITNTQHVFVSSFLPYEEDGEDINTNFTEILESKEITSSGVVYKSDIQDHKIYKNISGNWEIAVGRDIFGDKMSEGSAGTGVFLNSPTGVVDVENKLVFSDTLNDRILYLSGGLVYTLLNESNGLKEPTGLVYDSINKKLYIANSGAGEVLEFSSPSFGTNPDVNINFTPESSFMANKIKLDFYTGAISLTNPDASDDFVLTGISSGGDDVVTTLNNRTSYYFLSGYQAEVFHSECLGRSNGDIIINTGDTPIYCTASGTGMLANFLPKNFNAGSDYDISVSDISPQLSDNTHYYSKLTFQNGANIEYEKNFSYFTQGDNDIFTKDDNTLKVFTGGLYYPTGLGINGLGQVVINTFEDRKTHTYNMDGSKDSELVKIPNFTHSIFSGDYYKSLILDNPVKDINITSVGDLLNIKLHYYKYLNCYNPDEKIEKTLLLKKSF